MANATKTKTCSKCNEEHPLSKFERRLTLAQSKALLRNPNLTRRHVTISKLCSYCRQDMKSKKPLTAKQIRNKITSGDIPQLVGEQMIREMREALPARRAKAMKERWQKVKALPILKVKDSLSRQVATYARRFHSSTYLRGMTKQRNKWNYQEARRVKADLFRRLDAEGLAALEDINENTKLSTFFKPMPDSWAEI